MRSLAACGLALSLAACAMSGPTYTQMQQNERPLADGEGRIYIYRTAVIGAAVQPSVRVDGVAVGDAVPRGFFFVDRPAGNYKISMSTEVERTLSVILEAGQRRYVRLDPSPGFFIGHMSPELVDNQKGEDEIKDCHYIGKP